VKLSGHMSVKGAPPARSRVCAQAECSEARLVAPGADPARARRRGRRELPLPTLGSSCQLISTVTETKQGVTPRGKDAWARQILYYFTTVGPTGWCVAMPLRCGRRGSVGCLGGPRCTNDADEREPNERRSRADDRLRRVRTRGKWQDRLPFTIAREMQRRAEAGH